MPVCRTFDNSERRNRYPDITTGELTEAPGVLHWPKFIVSPHPAQAGRIQKKSAMPGWLLNNKPL